MSHVSSPRSESPARSHEESAASDKKSGSRTPSDRSRSPSISLVDVSENASPFREDRRLTEILDRLGETANVRKVIHQQEIDVDAARLLTVETLAATGIPKESAQRILDEVAKLKEAQLHPAQIEERMDNVHMSDKEADDTQALLEEIAGSDAKVQADALEDVRALASDNKHRRALTRACIELVSGGRHPALTQNQRLAVSVLAEIVKLVSGREYLRERHAVALITPVVVAATEEKEYETAKAGLVILAELIALPDCLRELRERPDIAAELIRVGHAQNGDVQYQALSLLAKLTLGSGLLSGEIDALRGGGIPALVRLATTGNDNRVKGAACKVLGAACSGDYMHGYMQSKFSEADVSSIAGLLNSNDEYLRAGSAYAIAYIADNNWKHKRVLKQYGMSGKLIELLGLQSPDVQESAARALRGLIRDKSRGFMDDLQYVWRYRVNKALATSIKTSGAVNALANLLKSNHASLRNAGLSALSELAHTSDAHFKRQLSEACTPKTVVAALSDDDPHTHFFALSLIAALTIGNDPVMEQYLVAGVVPHLKHLQASQDPEVQNLAYHIYMSYSHNSSRFNILSYSGYGVR